MRVAVIGTGIAGNAAAWALSDRYPVTVYERELRPGGHSHTVNISYEGTPISVDIGFIVYNELNYPDLTAMFAHLGVDTVESCMSFAVTADGGRFEWKGGGNTWIDTAKGLFAQPRNLLSPSYLWMLRDILTFNTQSTKDYEAGKLAGITLREYFRQNHFAPRLLTDYLAPMGAAIWSAPAEEILDFPAENFVAFFSNHRLLQYDRPVWRTVKGGSRSYVEKLTVGFRDRIRLGCSVTAIERTPHGVVVHDSHGKREAYDHVVLGSHSDQALAMLSDADERESEDSRRHRLFAEHGLSASRRELDAETSARLGLLELPSLAARGHCPKRRRGHLLDEPPAGDRQRQAVVRQPQSPVRAGPCADLRQIHLRASAIQRRGLCRAEAARRNPGPPPHMVLRRLDRIRVPRRWLALGAGRCRSAGRGGTMARAAPRTGGGRGIAMAGEVARPAMPDDAAALYFGDVMHARLKPMGHRFSYRVMSLLIDLDRLDQADRLSPLFAVNRAGLYSFHERDHGERDGSSLRAYAERCASSRGIDLTGGRVLLLCYPRQFGYTFNPLSVYFCYRADGTLALMIYEVRNTFGDIHPYVLPVKPDEISTAGIRQEQDKLFYVSPFLEMTMRYRFRISPPGQNVKLRILETDREGPLLAATFSGRRRALTSSALLRSLAALPLLTFKIIAAIHWEALRLWLKGARLVPRSTAPARAAAAHYDARPLEDRHSKA